MAVDIYQKPSELLPETDMPMDFFLALPARE